MKTIEEKLFLTDTPLIYLDYQDSPMEGHINDYTYMKDYCDFFYVETRYAICYKVEISFHQALKGHFPNYLPIDYLYDKRDGDKVKITSKQTGETFIFTCCIQDKSTSFERKISDAFKNLTARRGYEEMTRDKVQEKYFPEIHREVKAQKEKKSLEDLMTRLSFLDPETKEKTRIWLEKRFGLSDQ